MAMTTSVKVKKKKSVKMYKGAAIKNHELILWLDWLQCVSPRWKRSAQLQFFTDRKPYNLRG